MGYFPGSCSSFDYVCKCYSGYTSLPLARSLSDKSNTLMGSFKKYFTRLGVRGFAKKMIKCDIEGRESSSLLSLDVILKIVF